MRIINFIKNHLLLKIQLQGEKKSQSRRRRLDPAWLWCHTVAIEHTDIIEIHYCTEPIRAGSRSTAWIINNANENAAAFRPPPFFFFFSGRDETRRLVVRVFPCLRIPIMAFFFFFVRNGETYSSLEFWFPVLSSVVPNEIFNSAYIQDIKA